MAFPAPEPVLVIGYAYLWHHEHLGGREEGRKDRPSAIVFASKQAFDGATMVTVLPITHSPPDNPDWAVEIPAAVKRNLGLDDQRSWIVVGEGNRFLWPGYDLRPVGHTDRIDYGFLPPRLLRQVQDAFAKLGLAGKGLMTERC